MSILIQGVKMPKDCLHCFMPCELPLESALVGKRMDNCPLVEVPTPHGRLGDIDKLSKKLCTGPQTQIYPGDIGDALLRESYFPTIIEAEEEEA